MGSGALGSTDDAGATAAPDEERVAVDTAEPRGNWSELVRTAGARHADRPALIGPDRTVGWAELDAAADAGAADLLESGAHQGDRVVIAVPSSPEAVLSLVAVARAGLVAVPVDPQRSDLQTVLGRVGGAILVAADAGDVQAARIVRPETVRGWWAGGRAPVTAAGGGEDLAILARASRSYRAVMIPHRAVLAAVDAVVEAAGSRLGSQDRAVMVLPVHHLAGLVTALLPLAVVGAAAVFPAVDPAGGDLTGLPALVHDHRVTIVPGAPGVYRALLASSGVERAVASVHLMTSGAAQLSPSDFSAVRAVTGQPVWEGYGISEATGIVSSSLMTPRPRVGSVGRPMAGVRIRIEGIVEPDPDEATPIGSDADAGGALDTAEVTGLGDVGRICLSGPVLFTGYWPDGDGGPDAQGWHRSEDVGYLDDVGELHLVDRADETYTVAGFTVYPKDIEQVLLGHPLIGGAVVGAVPASGEVPARVVAVVALADPAQRPGTGELEEFVAQRLPIFKRPTTFAVVDAIPLTELGRQNRSAALDLAGFVGGVREVAVPPAEREQERSAASEPPAPPPDTPDEEPDERATEPFEPAADLDVLGERLPGTGNRRTRSMSDDDDLFGDEFS